MEMNKMRFAIPFLRVLRVVLPFLSYAKETYVVMMMYYTLIMI